MWITSGRLPCVLAGTLCAFIVLGTLVLNRGEDAPAPTARPLVQRPVVRSIDCAAATSSVPYDRNAKKQGRVLIAALSPLTRQNIWAKGTINSFAIRFSLGHPAPPPSNEESCNYLFESFQSEDSGMENISTIQELLAFRGVDRGFLVPAVVLRAYHRVLECIAVSSLADTHQHKTTTSWEERMAVVEWRPERGLAPPPGRLWMDERDQLHPIVKVMHAAVSPARNLCQGFYLASYLGVRPLIDEALGQVLPLNPESKANEKKVLVELGCGNGALLYSLCPPMSNLHCYGVDFAPALIKDAQRHIPHINFRADIAAPHIPTGHATALLSHGVVIYLSHEQLCAHIGEALRLLKPGAGRYVIWMITTAWKTTKIHPSFFVRTSPATATRSRQAWQSSSYNETWTQQRIGNHSRSTVETTVNEQDFLPKCTKMRVLGQYVDQLDIILEESSPIYNPSFARSGFYAVVIRRNTKAWSEEPVAKSSQSEGQKQNRSIGAEEEVLEHKGGDKLKTMGGDLPLEQDADSEAGEELFHRQQLFLNAGNLSEWAERVERVSSYVARIRRKGAYTWGTKT